MREREKESMSGRGRGEGKESQVDSTQSPMRGLRSRLERKLRVGPLTSCATQAPLEELSLMPAEELVFTVFY